MTKHSSTIQEIADRAGVPVQLVSKVILGQPGVDDVSRSKIQQAMSNIGLIKMSDSRTASQKTIVAVIPGQVIEDYIGGVVQGVAEAAGQAGYALEINIQNPAHEDTFVSTLERDDCAGVIPIVPWNYQRIITLCKQYQRQYVLIDYVGDDYEVQQVPTVEVNNYQGMKAVMQHLLQLGHRRIGFITGMMNHVSAQQRFQAYQDSLIEALIPYEPHLVREGNWMHPAGHEHGLSLLNMENPPTAIVGANDLTAFGVIHAAREIGLEVGTHVSVTGFDDIAMAATVNPPLTTVRQPMHQLGQVAAQMLHARVTGAPLPELHVVLDTELVVRQSTGPALTRR